LVRLNIIHADQGIILPDEITKSFTILHALARRRPGHGLKAAVNIRRDNFRVAADLVIFHFQRGNRCPELFFTMGEFFPGDVSHIAAAAQRLARSGEILVRIFRFIGADIIILVSRL
jgi:hypothetical protein